MDTNKMREEFIRAYQRLLIAEGMKVQESRFEVRDGEFAHRETAIAWWAWQASREAVLVELLEPHMQGSYMDRQVIFAEEVRQFIEAQSLAVAP